MEKKKLLQEEVVLNKPELYGLKMLLVINIFLLVTDFVMPQYFGVHLGYDITCTRLANMLLAFYAILHTNVFNLFSNVFLRCSMTIPLVLYLFVALYTMIFRVDINAFMLVFLEVLTMYMLIFAIRYVIGIRRSIKIILMCSYFLCAYGFIEFAAGQSLYLKFLRTMATNAINTYRSGYYRIMGPCGHPLGYGLLLILLISIACIDYEKNEIYLYKRPILLVMLIANVFMTGSRSSQGVAAVEIILIMIFSSSQNRKKAFFYSFVIIIALAIFLSMTFMTRIGNYILMQITMLIDQAFGTEIAANFGADVTTLQNSEGYREFLPYIFKLDWLNPLLGRGVKHTFGAEVYDSNGNIAYVHSVDNYFVSQFIKYAYPGLICYSIFIITTGITMIYGIIKYKSEIMKVLFISFCCYFYNLWWLDALQTLKFVYVIIALFFALFIYYKDFVENNRSNVHESYDALNRV